MDYVLLENETNSIFTPENIDAQWGEFLQYLAKEGEENLYKTLKNTKSQSNYQQGNPLNITIAFPLEKDSWDSSLFIFTDKEKQFLVSTLERLLNVSVCIQTSSYTKDFIDINQQQRQSPYDTDFSKDSGLKLLQELLNPTYVKTIRLSKEQVDYLENSEETSE